MVFLTVLLLLSIFGVYLIFKKQSYRYIGLAIFVITGLIILNYVCRYFSAPFISRALPLIVNCAAAIGFAYFVIIEYKIHADARHTDLRQVDYLIVNGAKLYGRTPSPSLQDRLIGTLNYMESNPTTVAVLTGKKWPYSKISEAEFMYEWLINHNISQNRLILEKNASNTLENVRFSIERICQSTSVDGIKIGILTSDYHLHRALYIARKEHITAIGIAVPTGRILSKINYFIREAFAMTEIYIFGVEGI